MSVPKLELRKISKTFNSLSNAGIKAVQDVTLVVRDLEIVSLIGPSGCGKSTLLDIVAGLTNPEQGEVFIDGSPVTGRKGLAGYMPQKDVLFPWRTVLDNVIVALEIQGISKKAARKEAFSLLPVFGLEKFAASYPHELSGGMRQRASFLRTYLSKRELLLLDEPFGKLDALTKMQMQQWLLKMWQKFSHTILFVTHDVDEAIFLSDRIYIMAPRPGHIMAELVVEFPRPREFTVTTDPAFAALKRQILDFLGDCGLSEVAGDG